MRHIHLRHWLAVEIAQWSRKRIFFLKGSTYMIALHCHLIYILSPNLAAVASHPCRPSHLIDGCRDHIEQWWWKIYITRRTL